MTLASVYPAVCALCVCECVCVWVACPDNWNGVLTLSRCVSVVSCSEATNARIICISCSKRGSGLRGRWEEEEENGYHIMSGCSAPVSLRIHQIDMNAWLLSSLATSSFQLMRCLSLIHFVHTTTTTTTLLLLHITHLLYLPVNPFAI